MKKLSLAGFEAEDVDALSSLEELTDLTRPVSLHWTSECPFDRVPEELLLSIAGYLDSKSQFDLCVACNRCVPQVWGVVLVCYTCVLKTSQKQTEEIAILTEIASSSQAEAHGAFVQCLDRKGMLQCDDHYRRRNEWAYAAELDALQEQENETLQKFQCTVSVLKQVMEQWCDVCKQRDKLSKMCQSFHQCIAKVFHIAVTVSS